MSRAHRRRHPIGALAALAACAAIGSMIVGCTTVTSYTPAPIDCAESHAPTRAAQSARSNSTLVHRVRFPLTNAYIVESLRTGRVVIVDTGPPGKHDAILRALDDLGIARDRASAIILTHAHRDHAGAAAELRDALGAPILIHALDAPELADGWGGSVRANTPPALLALPFSARRYPAFEADQTLTNEQRLDSFGIDGVALHTPGHTDGSLSIVLDSGDAVTGDLIAGALFDPDLPDRAFFHGAHAPTDRIDASLRTILEHGATRLFLGHGGPVSADDVRRFIDKR